MIRRRFVIGIGLFIVLPSTLAADPPQKVTFGDLRYDARIAVDDDAKPPERISRLVDSRITIVGYIEGTSMKNVTGSEFTLVRNAHAFHPRLLTDGIVVKMARGLNVTFTTRPIAVSGKFKLQQQRRRQPGISTPIYLLDDARVSPYVPGKVAKPGGWLSE